MIYQFMYKEITSCGDCPLTSRFPTTGAVCKVTGCMVEEQVWSGVVAHSCPLVTAVTLSKQSRQSEY